MRSRSAKLTTAIGLIVATALLSPAFAVAEVGGAGSGTGGTGTDNYQGQIYWTYKDTNDDNYGAPTLANVDKALADTSNGKSLTITRTEDTTSPSSAEITQAALNAAVKECETRVHHTYPSADPDCRLVGVGAVATDGYYTGADGAFTQSQWLSVWNSAIAPRTFWHRHQPYTTSNTFTDGNTSINGLVARETASPKGIVVIVLSQFEPPVAIPPAPPTKSVQKATSADSMTNTTTITQKTGTGGEAMVLTDTINSRGMAYSVTTNAITDKTAGKDVTGLFDMVTVPGSVVATWRGGDLPTDHEFVWKLGITVKLPQISQISDVASVTWNDKPVGSTSPHTFTTWKPQPDKVWVKRLADGKYVAAIDPKKSNEQGIDGSTILDGERLGAVINVPIASDLAQAPQDFTVTDDFSQAEYLLDLGDITEAKVYFGDASSDTASSVTDIAGNGEEVTDHFVIARHASTVTATADSSFRNRLKGLSAHAQVSLFLPFVANFADGDGAAQVRGDYGKKPGEELSLCTDTTTQKRTFSNGGSVRINGALEKTNEPTLCGYVPPVYKDVVAAGDEDGTQSSIAGKSVDEGDVVEYHMTTQPHLPDDLATPITEVSLRDVYDARTRPNKQTLEITDVSTGKVISKNSYSTQWEDGNHAFTVSLNPELVRQRWQRGQNPQLLVRFEAVILEGVEKDGVANAWTLKLNNSLTPSNKVITTPHDPHPQKTVVDAAKSINVDGKTVLLGDTIWYRLKLDAKNLTNTAYRVMKLGVVDDYDEKYLKLDESALTVTDSNNTDVTSAFNYAVIDGVVYVFAKTVDTISTVTGETLLGDPQPENLATYAAEPVGERLASAGIDPGLLGETYWVNLPMTVISVEDEAVVTNQAVQVTNNLSTPTGTVENQLRRISPHKDVVMEVAGGSVNTAEITKKSHVLYRLDSSVIPGNRANSTISEWSLVDDYDQTHDTFTGQWAVYATKDIFGKDSEKLYSQGQAIMINSEQQEALTGITPEPYVSLSHVNGIITLSATQAFLDIASAMQTTEGAWSVYLQMERSQSGKVTNFFTETVNDVIRRSNDVVTVTRETRPSVTVEKFDTESGATEGDRDSEKEALTMSGDTDITVRITNSGDTPLTHLTLRDELINGSGQISDIRYPSGWPDLVLQPGHSVDVHARIAALAPGQKHTDRVTVTAKPVETCPTRDTTPFVDTEKTSSSETCNASEISDSDDWNGVRLPITALADTGGTVGLMGVLSLSGLSIGIPALVAGRRRTGRHHAQHCG